MLYKIINNLTPVYTKDPIPPLQQSHYSLRNQDVVGQIEARTEKFKCSFYPHCLSEWYELDPEIRLAPSVAVFKKKLLSIIRPPARSIFGLLAGVSPLIRPYGHTDLQHSLIVQILLYGDKNFPDEVNKDILLLTLKFIHKSGRFDLI